MNPNTILEESNSKILKSLIHILDWYPKLSCLNCVIPYYKVLLYAQRNSCFLQENEELKILAEKLTNSTIQLKSLSRNDVKISKLPISSFDNTPLHYAVLMDDINNVDYLVRLTDLQLEAKNMNGETPLHLAVKAKNFEYADKLLNIYVRHIRCDINPKDNEGISHFHIVAIRNKVELAKQFIQCNVNINDRTKDDALNWPGCTPLHVAIKFKSLDVVNLLVENGAKIDIVDAHGITAEQLAQKMGIELAKGTIKSDYEIENTKAKDVTKFHRACLLAKYDDSDFWWRDDDGYCTRYSFIKDYLNSGGQVNLAIDYKSDAYPGWTALHLAIWSGELSVVKLLLKYNADISAKNLDGNTPLHLADALDRTNIIDLILDSHNGTSFNPTNREGLSHFLIACKRNNTSAISRFLKRGAAVNSTLKFTAIEFAGFSALHFAVHNKKFSTQLPKGYSVIEKHLEFLGKGCVKVGYRYKNWLTKIYSSNFDIIKLLIDNGGDMTQGDAKGMTPLHIADFNYNNIIIDFFFSKLKKVTASNPTNYFGYSHFHIACKRGNLEVVKLLLRKHHCIDDTVNFDSPYWPGYTGLHFAVEMENIELINILLENGAKIHMKNSQGQTPLHIANKIVNKEIIDIFFNFYSDNLINVEDNYKLSFFHISCARGKLETVKQYVNSSICVNSSISANSPTWPGCSGLHLAAMYDHVSIVQFLLRHNADVYAEGAYGLTPLHFACQPNDKIICESVQEVIWPLFEDPSKPYDDVLTEVLKKEIPEHTFLKLEKKQTKFEIVKALVDHGCDVNKKDKSGKTALFYTFISAHMIADYEKNDEHPGALENTVQTKVLSIFHNIRVKIIKYLLEKNAVVNEPDCLGWTVMHLLVSLCFNSNYPTLDDKKLLNVFLEKGANINSQTHDGISPLHIASKYNNEELVKDLYTNGADINCTEAKNLLTPLHVAALRRHDNVIEILLKNGANVFMRDKDGKTALHSLLSIYYMYQESVTKAMKLLIDAGVDVNARDKDGNTALHMKNYYTHDLLINGADINVENNEGLAPPIIHYHVKDQGYYPRCDYEYNITPYQHEMEKLRIIHRLNRNVEAVYLTLLSGEIYCNEANEAIGIMNELKESGFFEKCEKEIDFMKNTKITDSCTLYDFLLKDENDIVFYIGSSALISIVDKLDEHFEQYKFILKSQYLKGCIRKKLLLTAENVLAYSFGSKLTECCCREIAKNLDNDDLYILLNDYLQ